MNISQIAIEQDARYEFSYEWCGHPKPRCVLRFCDEWIDSFVDHSKAMKAAIAHRVKFLKNMGQEFVMTIEAPRYTVLTYTLIDGWVNCWSEDGEPLTFATIEEAEAEIEEYLDALAEVAENSGREYDREEERSTVKIEGPEQTGEQV